jgi:hypothetical protein
MLQPLLRSCWSLEVCTKVLTALLLFLQLEFQLKHKQEADSASEVMQQQQQPYQERKAELLSQAEEMRRLVDLKRQQQQLITSEQGM